MRLKMKVRPIFTSITIAFLLYSCGSNKVYDTMVDLEDNEWPENKELSYTVDITDIASPYTIYYTARYNNDYPYYNLYITRFICDSAGKMLTKKLQNMDLFDSKTGMPYGGGIGSWKDFTILSEQKYKFPYKGKYIIKARQYMRQDTLKGIAAFGYKIEKNTAH